MTLLTGRSFTTRPARDQHVGSCPGDEDAELLGNVLLYNGERLTGTRYVPLSGSRAR